jgi:hypothetical protein
MIENYLRMVYNNTSLRTICCSESLDRVSESSEVAPPSAFSRTIHRLTRSGPYMTFYVTKDMNYYFHRLTDNLLNSLMLLFD